MQRRGTSVALSLPWIVLLSGWRGEFSAPYNVSGNAYPTFSSVIALWAALALEEWNEPFVNVPVLFCGVALALAMYGQARECGLPRWAAVFGAYNAAVFAPHWCAPVFRG